MNEFPAPVDRVGSTLLGIWRVLRKLGAGGMGTVYEVRDIVSGERRAMKVLHPNSSRDAAAVSRLLREAAIAGSVKSPHLVQVFSTGTLEDGSSYLMMELLRGRSLARRLSAEGRMPVAEVVRLGDEIARGLAAVHAAGVVHRDMSPKNILLVSDGGRDERVKIVDFGLSKHIAGMTDRFGHLTSEGAFVGTPYYVSPEQAGGRRVDARADQYGLAVILYECLSGERPYGGDSLLEVLGKIASGEHIPLTTSRPDIRPELSRAISKAMSVDPERRFPDVITFVRQLAAEQGVAVPLDLSYSGTAPVVAPRVIADDDFARGPTAPVAVAQARPPRSHGGGSRVALIVFVLGVLLLGLGIAAAAVVVRYSEAQRERGATRPVPTVEPAVDRAQEAELVRLLDSLATIEAYDQCVSTARTMPRTPRVLEAQIRCARRGRLDDELRLACAELSSLAPAHAGTTGCIVQYE